MRVVLCCLAKNEELYINDFVSWYLSIGVDKIYIYDNNDISKGNSLEKSISSSNLNKCEIINVRGQSDKCFQHNIYTNFYNTYKDTFDWCLFVDIDEYLNGISNIKRLLSLHIYNKFKQIRIKWLLFGDDDLIERDMNLPVYKAFKKPIYTSLHRNLQNKGNLEYQGKCIVRGGLNNVVFTSVHYARYTNGKMLESCLPNGMVCYSKVVINERYNCGIYLHHYMTKSLSEFINQKLNRNDAVYNTNIKLDYFWRINNKTQEKLDYIKQKLGTQE